MSTHLTKESASLEIHTGQAERDHVSHGSPTWGDGFIWFHQTQENHCHYCWTKFWAFTLSLSSSLQWRAAHDSEETSEYAKHSWQYVQIVQGGESFISLSQGLQNALSASGGSPQQHRSDSLSAAYKNSGGRQRKQLTKFYEELCSHYRLQPTRNNLGVAHENGSIESPHGYFKRRLEQALRLRGSYDFISVESYQNFIQEVIDTLNVKCSERFMEEQPWLTDKSRG